MHRRGAAEVGALGNYPRASKFGAGEACQSVPSCPSAPSVQRLLNSTMGLGSHSFDLTHQRAGAVKPHTPNMCGRFGQRRHQSAERAVRRSPRAWARQQAPARSAPCRCPPRAVRTPLAFRASAMARCVVAPAASICRTIGSTLPANASASARCVTAPLAPASARFRGLPSFTPRASRAARVTREFHLWRGDPRRGQPDR